MGGGGGAKPIAGPFNLLIGQFFPQTLPENKLIGSREGRASLMTSWIR